MYSGCPSPLISALPSCCASLSHLPAQTQVNLLWYEAPVAGLPPGEAGRLVEVVGGYGGGRGGYGGDGYNGYGGDGGGELDSSL